KVHLMSVVGNLKTLAEADAPMDKKILVDVGAFHPLLLRASYNRSTIFDAVAFVKNTLLRKFENDENVGGNYLDIIGAGLDF
ncbi:hypothetical protein BGZ52_009838, partial [Haplosporangium bisporale]